MNSYWETQCAPKPSFHTTRQVGPRLWLTSYDIGPSIVADVIAIVVVVISIVANVIRH